MAILNPYLNFQGAARDAMTFYAAVFGGDLRMSSYAELGGADSVEADEADLIMHAQLETPDGFHLMASDTPKHMGYTAGNNFSVSLGGEGKDDDERLRALWAKLSEGATIDAPLETAPWGDSFGALHDKFGVSWLVNIGAGAGMGE